MQYLFLEHKNLTSFEKLNFLTIFGSLGKKSVKMVQNANIKTKVKGRMRLNYVVKTKIIKVFQHFSTFHFKLEFL